MFTLQKSLASVIGVLILLAALAARGENWPQFRGPTGQGISAEKNLPITWGGKTLGNVLWSSALVGVGNASPIVWGDRVFVCTTVWKNRGSGLSEHHVLCYDAAEGKLLWDTVVPPGPWAHSDFRCGPDGGQAGCTPVTDGRGVYCVFGTSVIAGINFQGKLVWRQKIEPCGYDCAIGSSPILYKNNVLFLAAVAKDADSRVQLFDKRTGESTDWKLGNTGFAHSTPLVCSVAGKEQVIIASGGLGPVDKGLRGLDPQTGKAIWWLRCTGEVPTPVTGAGLIYFDNGRGADGLAVDPTGSGDVTKTHVRWSAGRIDGLASPLIVGDYLYRLTNPKLLRCMQLSDGKKVYANHLEGLTSDWASPVADADGHLFFASAGKSVVVKAGPKFEVLAVNDLGDPNHASPAISGGRIFLAGQKKLYCIGKK